MATYDKSKLKDYKYSDLKSFLGLDKPGSIDEATLTQEELQDRLDQYNALSGSENFDFNYEPIQSLLEIDLQNNGFRNNIPQIADSIKKFFGETGHFPNKNEILGIIDKTPKSGERDRLREYFTESKVGEITKRVNEYVKTQKPDFTGDIKRVQDLYNAGDQIAKEDTAFQNFLTEGPKTLADITDQQIAGERQRGIQTLQDLVIPEVRQGLNVRGLLDSGDLTSEVARAAGEVLSPIEQLQNQLQEADQAFFMDAAYQDTLRKSMQGSQDLSGFIQNQQAVAKNASDQRFQQGQNAIKDIQSLSLFQRQNQRALDAQTSNLKRQQDLQNRQSKAGLYGQIGSGVGTLAGLGIATLLPGVGTAGMIAGATIGGTAGGLGGGIFSKSQ